MFDARRPPANLIFAVVEVLALLVIFYGPTNEITLALAFAAYGFTLSGLMASLGGLFAVDIAPRGATGAAMGFVGVFSYLAAATQDVISASLIGAGVSTVDGVQVYTLTTRSCSGSAHQCCRLSWRPLSGVRKFETDPMPRTPELLPLNR